MIVGLNCTKRITMKRQRSKGLMVQPDDLQVGNFYAVYGKKSDASEPIQISGLAFRLTALNLPFLVGKLACDPAHAPITFDARFLNFMKVSDEFVMAQRPAEEKP